MPFDADAALSLAATVCTIAYFLTPTRTIREYVTTKSTGATDVFPFIATIINCTLWTKYGILRGDTAVTTVNATGLVLGLVYVAAFYKYTTNRPHVERQLLYAALFVYPVLVYARFFTDASTATRHIGFLAMIFSVVMFGSPLVLLKQVLATRNPAGMSLALSGMSLLVASLWTVYGLTHADVNIIVPNALGSVLALMQVGVIVHFSRTNYTRVL
ncbi:hypothetical protein GGF31_001301 [Allomyces arbusculus]|nr:hypothetical protein GGF31_001301 [Allomyces arbusculus]